MDATRRPSAPPPSAYAASLPPIPDTLPETTRTRMALSRRAADSSSVRHQLSWKGCEDASPFADVPPRSGGGGRGALTHMTRDVGVPLAAGAAAPMYAAGDTTVPLLLQPFQGPTFPEHNPKAYKYLPPAWTAAIRPAGVVAGGSSAYPYASGRHLATAAEVTPSLTPVPLRDTVTHLMHAFD